MSVSLSCSENGEVMGVVVVAVVHYGREGAIMPLRNARRKKVVDRSPGSTTILCGLRHVVGL